MCAQKNFAAAIGPDLCQRVSKDMKAFENALADATRNPTVQTVEDLATGADRLMHAIARVLIEVRRRMD